MTTMTIHAKIRELRQRLEAAEDRERIAKQEGRLNDVRHEFYTAAEIETELNSLCEERDELSRLSRAVQKAIRKYGKAACVTAYELNRVNGEGASSIALQYHVATIDGAHLKTTRQVDAAINAGAALAARGN